MIKYLSLFSLLLFAACATKTLPAQKQWQYVTDSADVFLPAQIHYLDSLYRQQKEAHGDIIKLLTIKDVTGAKDLHDYAQKYFSNYAYTNDTSSQCRLLIVFCISCNGVHILSGKTDRRPPDESKVKAIVDTVMIPRFSRGQDYDGIVNGSRALLALLNER